MSGWQAVRDALRSRPQVGGGRIALLSSVVALFSAAAVYALVGGKTRGVLIPKQSLVVWDRSKVAPGAADRADARFELVNHGRSPVRITGVDASCGCTKPTADREIVAPGATATVSVSALVPEYAVKLVTITVHTDSPIRPDVDLGLRILGLRMPPVLLGLSGDLAFTEGCQPGETREIEVATVEAARVDKVPKVWTDLPFLRIREVGVDQTPHDDGFVLRRRKFMVGFSETPPPRTCTGRVFAEDPWNPGASSSLSVLRRPRALTATPSFIRLTEADRWSATILVTATEPVDDLVVSVEDTGPLRFRVETTAVGSSKRLHKITIKLEGRCAPGSHGVRLKIGGADHNAPITVPISVAAPDSGARPGALDS